MDEQTTVSGPGAAGQVWLAPLAAALATDEPLLILCRRAATGRAVYRFLAEDMATSGRKGLPPRRPTPASSVRGVPVLGGLHHEYSVAV